MSESVKSQSQAYRRGYANGFVDGQALRRRKAKVPFWRSLLSDHFREQFTTGYKQGYWDGEAQVRYEERRKQRAKDKVPKANQPNAATDTRRRVSLMRRDIEPPIYDERER